jgi:hypothetical protein
MKVRIWILKQIAQGDLSICEKHTHSHPAPSYTITHKRECERTCAHTRTHAHTYKHVHARTYARARTHMGTQRHNQTI